MGQSLVIVESPAKAKTINKFLGKNFVVKASMGHVRDLPKRNLGVDEETFQPTYESLPEKKKTLAELKKAARKADEIFLAPDPDREGEAICWHLQEELEKVSKADFHRVQFNEITKRAILQAFEEPKSIDMNRVDAQQARRVLDRLMGYKLSPLLWEKVRRGLSAGRVQSVALRIICEREREIQAFRPREYWSLKASLKAGDGPAFTAKLVTRNGEKFEASNQAEVEDVLAGLGWKVLSARPVENQQGSEGALILEVEAGPDAVPFTVTQVQAKERKKHPLPPFITSKLQQDAARQIGFNVAKTMRVAQGLYEGREIGEHGTVGLITYMRTDSTRVADEAIAAVRDFIGNTYGKESLPGQPRKFKVAKQAQEAHEAIRPTNLAFPPEYVKPYIGADELKLYTLIWNRFVASQMASAVFDTVRVDIEAGRYGFRANGSVLKFPGWLAVYHEARDEEARRKIKKDPEADEEKDHRLPPLEAGRKLNADGLIPRQHFTQPPPRFTEAALVKVLEEKGIGRPSTYATILSTITGRDYVEKEKRRFSPTELGFLVNDLMVESFGNIISTDYTARMEEELDRIEEGKLNWIDAIREFSEKFEADLENARLNMRNVKQEAIKTDQVCDKCGKPMVLKWGRFGKFLACSGYPDCKNTREVGEVEGVDTSDRSSIPAAAKVAGPSAVETDAEPCEKCGKPMVLRRGRFGKFLACSGYPDCKNTRKVTIGKDGRAEARADVLLEETCPRCKSKLARKHGRYGEFIACSAYPSCRYVKMNETGVHCPECNKGHLVERRSKRGKIFYGCDNYPDCHFILWRRPVNKPCPECGRPYLLERVTKKSGRQYVCEADNCEYSVDADAADARDAGGGTNTEDAPNVGSGHGD